MADNLEGSKGLDLPKMRAYLCTNIDRVFIYDSDSFQRIGQIPIQLLKTESREPNQIIAMQKSSCEEYLAVVGGKNLIMKQQKVNQIFIFKKLAMGERNYEKTHRVVVKDIPIFNKVCMQFHFQQPPSGGEVEKLIFVKQDQVLTLNFRTEEIETICTFKSPLNRQPEFFQLNDNQSIMVAASPEDGIYKNFADGSDEVDLDELFDIGSMKEIIHDEEDKVFYIVANKFEEKLGFFIVQFSDCNPRSHRFLTKWKNKLDIGDCSLQVMRQSETRYKELVVSYKTIYINTFNVTLMDISSLQTESNNLVTTFRHESFQLWESQCNGILLNGNKDFVTFSKEGMQVLALGNQEKRVVLDSSGNERMVHSLESMSYLKIDPENYVLFECAEDDRIVSIQQEFQQSSQDGEETNFDVVYSIKIEEITLRELLLVQSLFVCKTVSDIVQLVEDQPNPTIFYKSFLELDGANLASILSFDSRSMAILLDDSNSEYFSDVFPIFYKNKLQKAGGASQRYCYRSAIDNSLRNNQVRAVSLMIDYIVKYQNSFVSSYLFQKNLPVLFEKGIELHGLLASKVFCFTFDYDEWPSSHTDKETYLRPYNESLFKVRDHYRKVFYEPEFRSIDEIIKENPEKFDMTKVYKIKYQVNLLPSIGEYIVQAEDGAQSQVNEGMSIMSLCKDTEELEIFSTASVQQLIEFKWETSAKLHHVISCIMHFFYILTLVIYINLIYIHDLQHYLTSGAVLVCVGLLYPLVYTGVQMFKGGIKAYFQELGNYVDLVFLACSVANIVLALAGDSSTGQGGPFGNGCRILMIVILLIALVKSFSRLRIFSDFSPIVNMLSNVVYDLRIFLFFYGLLIVLFSLIMGILGVGNPHVKGGFRDSILAELGMNEGDSFTEAQLAEVDYFGKEYQHIGMFLANMVVTLRMSMGDFGFDAATELGEAENVIYWVVWIIIVLVTCVVFLNFIIAEASASYEKVSENLDAVIQKEKAALITEAEEMAFGGRLSADVLPKYIVVREIEL